MKSLICYFSTTGNTELACRYIGKMIPGAAFEFLDITRDLAPDLGIYDLVGFAAFADFLGPSKRMQDFIRELPQQKQKPAFVFNTYGNFNGGTLKNLQKIVRRRGFKVLSGFALQTPENVPPLIKMGMANVQFPNEEQLKEFQQFITELSEIVNDLKNGRQPNAFKIKFGLFNSLMPVMPRSISRKVMGRKLVDIALCNSCGICKSVCPYHAIELNPGPLFDQKKCYGCWSCYNHCPSRAIYTKSIKDKGHYRGPHELLKQKLGGEANK
jgi:ferredoxin